MYTTFIRTYLVNICILFNWLSVYETKHQIMNDKSMILTRINIIYKDTYIDTFSTSIVSMYVCWICPLNHIWWFDIYGCSLYYCSKLCDNISSLYTTIYMLFRIICNQIGIGRFSIIIVHLYVSEICIRVNIRWFDIYWYMWSVQEIHNKQVIGIINHTNMYVYMSVDASRCQSMSVYVYMSVHVSTCQYIYVYQWWRVDIGILRTFLSVGVIFGECTK